MRGFRVRFLSFPTLCALLSILVWGSTAAVLKIIVSNVSGIYLIAISSFIACAGLLSVILFQKKTPLVLEYFSMKKKSLFIAGFLGTFLSNWFFVEAVARLPAQEASILYYFWPLSVVIFSALLLKTRFTLRQGVGLIISFMGVIVVITQGNIFSLTFSNGLGVLFALGSALSYGIFLVLATKHRVDPVVGSFFYYGVATLLSFAWALFTRSTIVWSELNWLGLIWIGLGVSVIGLVSWITALQKGNAAQISTMGFLIPFVSLVYIYFLVGESIHFASILGLCLVIVGIFFQPRNA